MNTAWYGMIDLELYPLVETDKVLYICIYGVGFPVQNRNVLIERMTAFLW